MTQNLTTIDLFCGCGGLSKGLQSAGVEILAGVDIEPNYLSTFLTIFQTPKVFKLI